MRLLGGLLALVIVLGYSPSAHAAAKSCVSEQEARVRAAGDSGEEGTAPKFTTAFYKRMLLLDVSLDGADGSELPISVEEVCSVPKRLKKQAAQLAGGDGVALLLARTTVWQDNTQLTGDAIAPAIDNADTATLRVRLVRPTKWREDEDGNPVPTFRTGRIEITD